MLFNKVFFPGSFIALGEILLSMHIELSLGVVAVEGVGAERWRGTTLLCKIEEEEEL